MSQNQPIEMNLCHDWRGKPIIPFKYYVARPTPPLSELAKFFCFGQLPIELQFRIFQLCHASTLFTLMQTSSAIRTEAKKLFWSQRDTWYRCDSGYLTVMGGSPGPSPTCTKFSNHVQQLDILFTGLWTEFTQARPYSQIRSAVVPAYYLEWQRMSASEKMTTFWKTLKKRLPSVKRVVLSDHFPIEQQGYKDTRTPIAPEYAALIRACPPSFDLEVFVCLTDTVRVQYDDIDRLYKLVKGPEALWELVEDDFQRKLVKQGPKQFEGPVGAYQRLTHEKDLVTSQARGLRQLSMDLYIKYEFANDPDIYVCPKTTGCGAPFSTLKEWKRHVLTERHDIILTQLLRNTEYTVSPTMPVDALDEYTAAVRTRDNLWTKFEERCENYQKMWGEEGSSKRRQYELTFLAQLELDPEWEGSEPAKKCYVWENLQGNMDVSVEQMMARL
jgi:hypothetical protein